MNIALIARMDNGGLGIQTNEFFKNMRPTKTLVVDLSGFNNAKQYPERYKNWWGGEVKYHKGFLELPEIEWLCENVDLIFSAEIPYNYALFMIAKNRGVKTVLQYNYEFLDYTKDPTLPYPDCFLAPSYWHLDDMSKFKDKAMIRHLPFPVNRRALQFERKNKATKFLHIAGVKLYEDRNGTEVLLRATPFVKNPYVKFIIYSQHELPRTDDPRVEVRELNVKNYWELYGDGDSLVLPRRYGGLSLQLNEAMSRGMIPIMPNVQPQNLFLPKEMLFEPTSKKYIQTRGDMVECWELDPMVLAEKIDWMSNVDITDLNKKCDELADQISWANMKRRYLALFEEVLNAKPIG